MDAALDFAKRSLQDQYPDVDSSKLDALVAEGLLRAKGELQEETQTFD